MNVRMWGQALTVMPRITKEDWDGLDLVSRWLIASRAAVLVMTLVSAAFGGLLAAKAGAFAWGPFLLCALGLCLAHATNNLVNDLTDYWKGVDEDNYFRTQYGPQTVQAGFLSVRGLMTYAALTGLAAAAVGAVLVAEQGEGVLWLLGAGAFFVLFYTWPLKYIGLGEPAVLAVWGPLMVGGTYYVITGEWSSEVAWASIAYGLGPTAVLFGKHIDKLDLDAAKGIHTLPVLLGEKASRMGVLVMLAVQLLVTAGLIASGYFLWPMLLCFAAAPSLSRVWQIYRNPRPVEAPPELPEGVWPLYFVAITFWYNRRFGLLFVAGLLGDLILSRW
jgi:1,4-dihydroxy-2-naphthoate octaprenyltransferase